MEADIRPDISGQEETGDLDLVKDTKELRTCRRMMRVSVLGEEGGGSQVKIIR